MNNERHDPRLLLNSNDTDAPREALLCIFNIPDHCALHGYALSALSEFKTKAEPIGRKRGSELKIDS